MLPDSWMQSIAVDSANLFRLVHFFDVLAAVVFAVSGALVASRKGMDVMGFMWLRRDHWRRRRHRAGFDPERAGVLGSESRSRLRLSCDRRRDALRRPACRITLQGAPVVRCLRTGARHASPARSRPRMWERPHWSRSRWAPSPASSEESFAIRWATCLPSSSVKRSTSRRRCSARAHMSDSTASASVGLPAMIAGFLVTFGVRSLAIKFGWSLPVFRESRRRERWKSDRKDAARMRDDDSQSQLSYRGNDKLLFGIILGVLAFWLFAQTTLNIAPAMAADLDVSTNVMNIAVSITALFSGIFIVVVGGLADRVGTGEDPDVGVHPQHRRLAAGRDRAGRRVGGSAADAGPHLSGPLGRVHHAREPGAHQDVLGRRRPSTRGEPLVHGLVGRLGIRGALRRPHGRERRMALDLLRVGGGIGGRHADGARDTGEQGCRRERLSVRHDGCPDVHGDDGGIAGAGHSGK